MRIMAALFGALIQRLPGQGFAVGMDLPVPWTPALQKPLEVGPGDAEQRTPSLFQRRSVDCPGCRPDRLLAQGLRQ